MVLARAKLSFLKPLVDREACLSTNQSVIHCRKGTFKGASMGKKRPRVSSGGKPAKAPPKKPKKVSEETVISIVQRNI